VENEVLGVAQFPTASDIVEAEARICVQTAAVAAVEAEYKAMKRKMAAIEAKRTAMLDQLLESKAYLARIRTLPQEILGLIFHFYISDQVQSPWVLMQVTRAWRATALATRSLWARIRITSPAWQKAGASRRKDGREMCGTKAQLYRALRRAGNAPLDIQFALINPHSKRRYPEYDLKAIREMIGYLASSRKCRQVHNLEIDGPDSLHLQRWSDESDLEFPELRTLHIKSRDYAKFASKISETSTLVTEIDLMLGFGSVAFEGVIGLETFIDLPSLVSLSLNGRYFHGFRTESRTLKPILNNASSLTTLELTTLNVIDDPSARALQLPNLQTLVLQKSSRIWPLDAPRLTNLILTENSVIGRGPHGRNQFPLLRSLKVAASQGWYFPSRCFSNIQFPPLHTLDLCFGTRKDGLTALIAHQAELNPVIFCLRKTVIPTELLINVIDSMDRLEELQLENVTFKKEFFEYLASSKTNPGDSTSSPSDEVVVNCPLLVRLQVQLKNGTPSQNKNFKSMARKTVSARFKAGIAMEVCLIPSSDDDKKWIECRP
jgi:F-box-like